MLFSSQAFIKTWRIKNVGTCTWTIDYKLVFASGDQMGGPNSLPLPVEVAPGETFDMSVGLIAPAQVGAYQSNWELQSSSGINFGVGEAANKPIWVKLRVEARPPSPAITSTATASTPQASPTTTPVFNITYDFVENACFAEWTSNDGGLPCPGKDGDPRGFVLVMKQSTLEDGMTTSLPALLTFPQFSAAGYIQAVYPPYQVQAGDHFQTTSSCEYGATSCSVLYRLSVLDENGIKTDLWALGEFYDGKYSNVDLDLSSLAGKRVKFMLYISSLGSAVGDRALWVAPRIVHFPPSTSTPTATATPTHTLPAPSLTPSPTLTRTPLPPTTQPTSTAAAPSQVPGSSPSLLQQIIDFISSLLQRLFGK